MALFDLVLFSAQQQIDSLGTDVGLIDSNTTSLVEGKSIKLQ